MKRVVILFVLISFIIVNLSQNVSAVISCGSQTYPDGTGYCCDTNNGANGVWFRGDYYSQCPSTPGNYRYVSNSGNDANDGLTPATAWGTMEKITNDLIAGQTGIIIGGDWNEQTKDTSGNTKICENVAVTMYPSRSGNSAQPILYKGHPDLNRPIIRGSGFNSPYPISVKCNELDGNGTGHCLHRAACIFQNWINLDYLEFTDAFGGPRIVGDNGIIQDVVVHDTVGSGGENSGGFEFLYNPSNNWIIRGSEFYNIMEDRFNDGVWNPIPGPPGVGVYRTAGMLIENNYFHDTPGGLQFKNGVSNAIVRWNIFKNNRDVSISHSCSDTAGIEVGNNTFYENILYSDNSGNPSGFGGFYFAVNGGGSSYSACDGGTGGNGNIKDIRVFNNVIYNRPDAGVLLHNVLNDGSSDNFERMSFFNNIISNIGTSNSRENLASFTPNYLIDFKSNYNLYYDDFETDVVMWGGSPSYPKYDLNTFRTSIRPDLEQNSTQQNPLFVNPAVGDFHLQPTSPAIDAGVVIPGYHCASAGPNSSGCREWYGLAPDIGAYEYNPGTPIVTCAQADVNDDLIINIIDLALVIYNQGQSLTGRGHLDIDSTGQINYQDVSEVRNRLGQRC